MPKLFGYFFFRMEVSKELRMLLFAHGRLFAVLVLRDDDMSARHSQRIGADVSKPRVAARKLAKLLRDSRRPALKHQTKKPIVKRRAARCGRFQVTVKRGPTIRSLAFSVASRKAESTRCA